MSDNILPSNGNEQLAKLVAKYRARRARRQARGGPPTETLEEFGQRVFGDEVGQEVLIDWLREELKWPDDEAEASDRSLHGR
jgi:hypothetical protein